MNDDNSSSQHCRSRVNRVVIRTFRTGALYMKRLAASVSGPCNLSGWVVVRRKVGEGGYGQMVCVNDGAACRAKAVLKCTLFNNAENRAAFANEIAVLKHVRMLQQRARESAVESLVETPSSWRWRRRRTTHAVPAHCKCKVRVRGQTTNAGFILMQHPRARRWNHWCSDHVALVASRGGARFYRR